MSKQIQALLGFSRALDADIVSRASAVCTAMPGNPLYSDSPVDLPTLKSGVDSYSRAIADALDGSKKAIAERNKQRLAVCNMLKQLGHYVEAHCGNDMAVFLSSGFQPVFGAG